ncbi:42394_t:CDS:1, partial [Gigaspora margarita]
DILNDTMNKTARKEDSPLLNQENYITKFIKTYITKRIPLVAITPDTTFPTIQQSKALKITPTF